MKIAITGGTGFIGRHFAAELVERRHEVVLVARGKDRREPGVYELPRSSFFATDLSSAKDLAKALNGCDAVAHLAGINREIEDQTYERVHVAATRNVVRAAEAAGVKKIALLSFLRARPDCGSPYHESKFAAEELVRASTLEHTILKAGVIYGRGDHMIDHLATALRTFHMLPLVGLRQRSMKPTAVEDVVRILFSSLVENRLRNQTTAVVGPEEMSFREAARRVAKEAGQWALIFPFPIWAHYLLARVFEARMKTPLASLAQVRILSEGLVDPLPHAPLPPDDLLPRIRFEGEQIRKGLPTPLRPFGVKDCLQRTTTGAFEKWRC